MHGAVNAIGGYLLISSDVIYSFIAGGPAAAEPGRRRTIRHAAGER